MPVLVLFVMLVGEARLRILRMIETQTMTTFALVVLVNNGMLAIVLQSPLIPVTILVKEVLAITMVALTTN